jgi:FAD-dependent oxidoreductase domain-containing protein 1
MSTIAVIGAGVVGTATALHLAEADAGLDVLLIETDPSYARAATGKGTGGIRQLFTRPENIALSQYTLDVVDDWATWAAADREPAPDLNW